MEKSAPIKILLVDDRNENLLALEVILASNKDYECIKAGSGTEALKILLQEQEFAIILMDVQMPIIDGFETAKLIRQRKKFENLPIIFLSGNLITPEDIFKGYQTGAVDYMIKPLSAEILKAKVAVFVDLYKKNKELQAQEENMKILNSQLRKQSKYVRNLIEASLDALITINSEGIITDMNEALENITGIPREKIADTPFADYFTNHEKAKEAYQEAFAKGTIVDYLLTIKNKDGIFIDVLCNGSVYKDDNGNVAGVVIVAREKLLSKYARTLIEASLDPLITINFEGKITDMNEALADITGMPHEKVKGTDFINYFTEQQKAEEVYKNVFANGFVANSPLKISNVNGKFTDVLVNGSVYKDSRGKILGAVIVARDITSQKIFEKELIEAKSKAEEAMQAKQQFLSNMSHEIRTPLNAIIGFTKLVLKTDLNEKQKEYLNAIKVSGDTLIVLIDDILDLAKVDAGKMTFEQIPFNLTESVSSMLHLFEEKAHAKNLKLIKVYDSAIPQFLIGDPIRLNQIILNLLSNAIKFTEKGKIVTTIQLLKEDEENVTLEFTVTDTGIGIPVDKHEEIFNKFQQAEGSTERLYGGTGLGLSIVKQFVEAQGGKVLMKSKVGQGSTFKFILSFKKANEKRENESKKEANKIRKNSSRGIELKNINILVAEDKKLNQLLIKTLLEEFGCNVETAANGKIAIGMLQENHNKSKNKFDIILMDLHMPEMNGIEATKYIRKEMKSEIPIIALTADVTTVDVEKCRQIGMNDYIAKPIDDKLLYRKILKFAKPPAGKDLNQNKETRKPDNMEQKHEYKYISLDYLKQLTSGNTEVMLSMIKVYLEEIPKSLQDMKESVEKKNWKSVGDIAHSMIPSFSMVGINAAFEEMARKIQEHAEKKEDPEIIKELVKKIEHVCALAIEELHQELNALEIH